MKTRIVFYSCLAAGLSLFAGIPVAALMVALMAAANTILDGLLGGKRLWKTAGQSLVIRSLFSLGLIPLAWLACRCLAGRWGIYLLGILAACGLALSFRRKKAPLETAKAEPWAFVAILAAVVILTWIPFSRIGFPMNGQYAYRAYFSSDYLKHFSMVEALKSHSMPPPNLYFEGEALHYYWLPYVVPALVSGIAGSTPKAMFGFSFCVNFLFLLLLLLTGQAICRRRKKVAYLIPFLVLAPSLEGFYLWAAKARFSPGAFFETAAAYNVDGLTRWLWGLPQIDTALRSMLFTPQHLLSLAFLLLFLLYAQETSENPAALSLSIALSFASSFFIGGLVLMVWGPYVIVREILRIARREQSPRNSIFLLAKLFALPAAVLGLSLALKMMTPGASVIAFQGLAPGQAAIELGLNFGLLTVGGIAGLAAVRFPGRGLQSLLLGVTLIFILFVRIVNFESDISLKFGLVAGLLLALATARLGDLPKAGRFVLPLALLVVLPGLFTLAADVRNSSDVRNRRFTSYVSGDEMKILEWAMRNIPEAKTLQNFPEGRTWNLSTIPAFSGRQMVVGDRSHGQIFQVRPELYERRLEALRRALSGLPATLGDLRRMGVDYLFWGEDERRAFKADPGLPVACRVGEAVLYSVSLE